LVLLVDVSAATDDTHLAMARTLVEAVLRRLNPDDRVTLLGADLDAHPLALAAAEGGKGKTKPLPQPLVPATAEQIQNLLGQLGAVSTGGATDLGAALSQAAALLSSDRPGAVLYVGDAQPTVGELDLPALRERLSRLPVPLRLYGVGVGAEANLDLLSGLCELSAGQAYRVGDRAAAAETALAIVTHLARPALNRISVDVGPGLDRVYPRQSVSLRAGEPLFILARLRQTLPKTVQVEGVSAGQPFQRTFRLEAHNLDDTADLRLRWSQARLLQLLDGGASTEEVAELGVRQNLITPFTSFYVPSEDELSLLQTEIPDVRAAGCSYDRSPPRAAVAPSEPAPPSPVVAASLDEGKMGRSERRAAPMKPQAPEAQAAQPAAPPPEVAAAEAQPPPPAAAAPMASTSGSAAAFAPMKAKKRAREQRDDDSGLDSLAAGGPGGPAAKADAFGGGGLGILGDVGSGRGGGGHGVARNLRHAAQKRPAPVEMEEGEDKKIAETEKDRSEDEAPSDGNGVLVAMTSNDVTVLVGILRHRPRGCSAASDQPLDERRDLWRERLSIHPGTRRALEVFQDAERGCELRRWTDRRELLKLMLRSCGGPTGMVALYKHFDDESEEQEFLRQAILGEVKSARDLRIIYDGLGLGDEERATLAQEVVRTAKTPADRLGRIAELLQRWPGDLRLRLLRMETEELLGRGEAARRTAEDVRRDPYADAQARTAVGELYIRLGDEAAARRAFSEIVEFAPRDPLARRRLGDLYRAHNWYDEAYRQYQTLLTLEPNDQSVLLLLASAAAGAGHIEEALGLEQRVLSTAEPGGETGVSRIALWQTALRLAELRQEARQAHDDEGLARLFLRAQKVGALALSRPVRVLLTWAHPEADLELKVAGPDESLGPAIDLAPQMGLLGWHSNQTALASQPYQIEVTRGDRAALLKYSAELTVIVNEGGKSEQLYRLPIAFDGNTAASFTLRGGKVEKAESGK
jgi:Ca-activated chloride channel family protein